MPKDWKERRCSFCWKLGAEHSVAQLELCQRGKEAIQKRREIEEVPKDFCPYCGCYLPDHDGGMQPCLLEFRRKGKQLAREALGR